MHSCNHNCEKVEKIVEELRTACQEDVYLAFNCAPDDNLLAMKNMITHILKGRKKESKAMDKKENK